MGFHQLSSKHANSAIPTDPPFIKFETSNSLFYPCPSINATTSFHQRHHLHLRYPAMAAVSASLPRTSGDLPLLHRRHCLPLIQPRRVTALPSRRPLPCLSATAAAAATGLIAPDGGELVDLLVEESARDRLRREAAGMAKVALSRMDLEMVHVLSEGWASPLRGFMTEPEFLQTLHFNSLRLADGSRVNMSVPIVLAIDDAKREEIGGRRRVSLVGPAGDLVAILNEWVLFPFSFGFSYLYILYDRNEIWLLDFL